MAPLPAKFRGGFSFLGGIPPPVPFARTPITILWKETDNRRTSYNFAIMCNDGVVYFSAYDHRLQCGSMLIHHFVSTVQYIHVSRIVSFVPLYIVHVYSDKHCTATLMIFITVKIPVFIPPLVFRQVVESSFCAI